MLKKVSVIDYDKKDCDLVVCPTCKQPTSFSIFTMTQKSTSEQHFHVRCIFCDQTYCLESPETVDSHDILTP